MTFDISDESRLLVDSARRFLADRNDDEPLSARWRAFADMGWLALPVAEKNGGFGASDDTLAALALEMGRARLDEPYLPTIVMAAGLLARLDLPREAALLESIAGGETLAVTGGGAHLSAAPADATTGDGGWTLQGTDRLLLGGDVADLFLLSAPGPDGVLRLFAVDGAAPGLMRSPAETIAGCGAADLELHGVAARLVADRDVAAAIDWARDRCAAIASAEAVGAIEALAEATIDYTTTRVQFGRTLSSFQVVEHAIAEILTLREEARAISQLAVMAIGRDGPGRERAISAAAFKVGLAGRIVSHQAIQLHGAMGVTDELDIGYFVKRLIALAASWGTGEQHLDRYAGLARAQNISGDYLAAPEPGAAVLPLDDEARTFQAEVRAFLGGALPSELRRAQRLTPTVYPEADVADAWQKILHRRGWSAANWPAGHGGTGWSPLQRYLWAQETGAAQAPIISPIGLSLVGPVLIHFGTAAQQQRYLTAILSGDELWCQGFSEPGAGSDLAALSTRAVRDGDDYVVNGSKIWTTHAHFAQLMVALVRTGEPGGRREGISLLIIDMHAPGISIRPIVTIGGDHEVNQVFLDDVRVPASGLVGAEGQGWAIAKFLLDYERGGDIMSAGHRALLSEIRTIALRRGPENPVAFWRAFAEVAIAIDTLEMLELRVMTGASTYAAAPSILKLRASEIQQAVTELGVRLLGADTIRWTAARPIYRQPDATGQDALMARYLNSRANTIFGGSREIQKTLIARAELQR